jgi:hypothetical protein
MKLLDVLIVVVACCCCVVLSVIVIHPAVVVGDEAHVVQGWQEDNHPPQVTIDFSQPGIQ